MMTRSAQQRTTLIEVTHGGKPILATTSRAGPAFQSIESNRRDSGRHQNLTPSPSGYSPQLRHGDEI
jgi:hypothetical protein